MNARQAPKGQVVRRVAPSRARIPANDIVNLKKAANKLAQRYLNLKAHNEEFIYRPIGLPEYGIVAAMGTSGW